MADDQPRIYRKPTTETIGDKSPEIRQYPLPTPQRARSPLRASAHYSETPLRRNIKEPSIAPLTAQSRTKHRSNDITRVRRKRRLPGRDFQHPQDMIAALCRTVSLPHRVAFERNTLTLDEKTYNLHAKNKRSPSLGHLYWIQRLQSVTKIRQVQFQNVLPDQYQAILSDTHELPSPAPTLSHKKTRLPHRADVGFPNATPEEIESKQSEIRNETVQEEACLRLIALVPDLGRQVGEQKTPIRSVPQKSKYSILTPPLQSIPSASQGWRPRLFHDRPSYLEYIYIHCEAPDGCLALYNSDLQKVSEDFWYSKGQKGIFGIPSGCEETLLLVWRQQQLDELFSVMTISYRHWPDLQDITMPVYPGRFSVERLKSIVSGTDVPDSEVSVAKKTGVMGRMFRTPQKPSKASLPNPKNASTTYNVRISFLGADFLQPLLSKPEHDTESKATRLLVDVSGDFAVSLEKQDSEPPTSAVKKRSNLLRLPKSTQPAGYITSAEFREVLYLPASQRYDYDRPVSYWSLVNLMYLYPRVLQITNANTSRHVEGFSIHIRACRIEGEHAVTIAGSFYSASSYAKLVDEVILEVTSNSFSSGNSVLFQDEYKLRLPVSLDKRFVLQVLLRNSIKETIGEVQVPLCSYSSTKSGRNRALTLIPNGNHRLKLADFQLQLESRLVSAIHVSDPCVATWLRDCTHSYTEKSKKSQGSATKEGQFVSVLSEASESAVFAYFLPLFYAHLWSLTQGDEEPGLSHLSSFFELLDKSKQAVGEKRLPDFIKNVWDEFDEIVVTNKAEPILDNESSTDNFHSIQEDIFEDDSINATGFSLRNNKKGPVFSRLDDRTKKIMRALGPSATPFSRTAYGASKIDRMRLEAELQLGSQSFALTPFFEDDETIATMPSVLTDSRSFIDSIGQSERFLLAGSSQRNIIRTPFPVSTGLQCDTNENEFATRVKTVAKVILAPCVGPSFSSILSSNMTLGAAGCFETQAAKEELKEDAPDKESTAFGVYPGSDDEQSREAIQDGEHHPMTESSFRGALDSPLFRFSLKFEQENQIPSGVCEYVYESIIVMWLRAWLDHVELIFREQASAVKGAATFSIPPYKFTEINTRAIFRFYGHMDLLLPLCLKSFIFRYNNNVANLFPPATKVIVDHSHMLILEPFVELLARGLVGEVLSGLGSSSCRDESLQRALQSSDIVLDFLVGLVSFLHPEHSRVLVSKFLHTLRNGETEHLGSDVSDINFRWDEESLHRVRCCRELRIHTIEALLMLPAFVNINYPLKYSGHADYSKAPKASWFQQYQDCDMIFGSTTSEEVSEGSLNKLPQSGWLAELLIGEGLSVSSLSSEAIVAEAIAQLEVTSTGSTASTMSLRKRPGAALSRDDLLMFQSLGLHAINVIYELGLRRHALDRRYQSNSARERTAALFASVVMDKCLSSVKWLARMDPTQKIRSLWLLSFTFVLQEAPDILLRHYVRRCCDPQNVRIHRFVRLLRLCSATFQTFTESHSNASPSNFDNVVAPWLLQESFNTICAASNIIIEECIDLTSNDPPQQERLIQGILDLLLNVLTSPQSSVTHLRVVGGALQVLETFGAAHFGAFVGQNLQHWIRIMISLMNSVSLSVRSIAVDFFVSLIGNAFDLEGSLESMSLVFLTVLPEVAAREIGLYTVSGHVSDMDDVSKALWPLRRALAELEDASPLDDDRVDPTLPYNLHPFCRASQAVLDGVLIELKLKWEEVLGFKISRSMSRESHFDADEESLFEAISFFLPESGPLQRIRWLTTLAHLHESKTQWVEAAEAMFLSARTIADSLPHLQYVWRPSRFALWSDTKRSLWLESVGEEIGRPDRGNAQIMDFANQFLEPSSLHGNQSSNKLSKLSPPTLSMMCEKLTEFLKRAIDLYLKGEGMVRLAYARLEELQVSLVAALGETSFSLPTRGRRSTFDRNYEDDAALRRVLASLSGDMAKLAERLLLAVKDDVSNGGTLPYSAGPRVSKENDSCFVRLRFSGQNKPLRFQESTTLPTFVDWDTDCVCRVSRSIVDNPSTDPVEFARQLCSAFVQPFVSALKESGNVIVQINSPPETTTKDDDIVIHASMLEAVGTAEHTRRFLQYRADGTSVTEITVAHSFPCALSRQRILLQSEIVPSTYTV